MQLQRLLALLTGAIVALCLGLGLVMMALSPPKSEPDAKVQETRNEDARQAPASVAPPDNRDEGRKAVEKLIAGTPEYAPFFDRLRETFPADYDSALNFLAADPTKPAQQDGVDLYLSEAVRLLRQSRGVLAAKADAAALGKVFEMQNEVLRATGREDPRMCVAFLYGATNQEFQRFAATRRGLVAALALAGLEAIVSGREKKIDRAAPSEADFKVLETALTKRGLGKAEIDALLDGKMPDPPLDDARMCAAGQAYLEVLRGLPEPVRLRIYGLAVELMARS